MEMKLVAAGGEAGVGRRGGVEENVGFATRLGVGVTVGPGVGELLAQADVAMRREQMMSSSVIVPLPRPTCSFWLFVLSLCHVWFLIPLLSSIQENIPLRLLSP
jgi:hypothetical protein